MTPAEMVTNIRFQANEPDPALVSDVELYAYIWQALYRIARKTGCLQTEDTSLTSVASTASYTVPESIMVITQLEWGKQRLRKITTQEFNTQSQPGIGGTLSTGTPTWYKQVGKLVYLYPTPTTAETITIYGSFRPTEVTTSNAATDIFTTDGFPEEFQMYAIDYVLYRYYLKDESTKADVFLGLWNEHLIDAKQEWAERNQDDEYNTVTIFEDYYGGFPF